MTVPLRWSMFILELYHTLLEVLDPLDFNMKPSLQLYCRLNNFEAPRIILALGTSIIYPGQSNFPKNYYIT